MADAADSKSADASRVGSTPTLGTYSEFAVHFDPKRLPKVAGREGIPIRDYVAKTPTYEELTMKLFCGSRGGQVGAHFLHPRVIGMSRFH